MKKYGLCVVGILSLVLSANALADCYVFFEGKTDTGKDISACSLNNEVFLKIGTPNTPPDLYIQSKESDVLYVEADEFIGDMSTSIYSLFIPNNGKWYGINFGRQTHSTYSTSVITSTENLTKANFYRAGKVESSTPIVRNSVTANIDFSAFTRIEDPVGGKEYEEYVLSFYRFAGFPVVK